jgi:hypothetical protein
VGTPGMVMPILKDLGLVVWDGRAEVMVLK